MTIIESFEFESIRYFKFGYNPIGKPSLFAYIYFVDGLLIDSGQRRMKREILSTLSPLDVQQMFITHHHEDHSGNIHPLKAQFDCPVYASELCCEMMKNPPPISLAQKVVWGTRPAYHDLIPITDHLETPNNNFTIIAIPGHAKDMVALYEPERKWLFSADLYVNSYIGYFLEDESIVQQIQSIKKILVLDFKTLFCSHNPRIEDGRQKLEEKLHFLEDFNQNVIEWYKKGYNAKEIYKILKMKEHGFIHILSHGYLSKLHMVKSVIRDFKNETTN